MRKIDEIIEWLVNAASLFIVSLIAALPMLTILVARLCAERYGSLIWWWLLAVSGGILLWPSLVEGGSVVLTPSLAKGGAFLILSIILTLWFKGWGPGMAFVCGMSFTLSLMGWIVIISKRYR